jgi:phage terminase large subunit-like protein
MKNICDISNYKSNDLVTSGNVSELMELQCRLWDDESYYFDVREAKRVVKFSRKLSPDKGKRGQKLRLCVFQFQIVTDILCVKQRCNNMRRFREAHINIGRKNGKSFIIAFLITYLFFFHAEYGGEFILASISRNLAEQLYIKIMHFIRNTPLEAYCKIRDSKKEIEIKQNNTVLRVISSDAEGANSYADYVYCIDEIHEMKKADLYDRLSTGQGTFDEPLGITITTAGDGENPLNLEYEKYHYCKDLESGKADEDSFYYAIYEADEGCDLDDEKQWLKANPGLDVFRKRKDLEILSKRAKTSRITERAFRRFFLNQHISSEIKQAINMQLFDECTAEVDYEEIRGLTNTAGLDLSSKSDITALVQCFYDEVRDKYIIYPHLFVPVDRIEDKEDEDRVPYKQWEKQGYINTFPGEYISYKKVKSYIKDNCENNEIFAFDRWGSPAVKEDLDEYFNMLDFGQGYRTMSPAINTFEELLMDRRIIIAKNPCFRWMAANVVAVMDDAGNTKYSKLKSRKKIDGIIAMVMAIGAMFADREYDTEKGLENYLDILGVGGQE